MAVDRNWSPVEELPFVPLNSEGIALAAGAGALHLVWTQGKTLYHARHEGDAWRAPVRIAGGEQPAVAVAPDGSLYCAYANWFLGNQDIYIARFSGDKWALPELLSRTTGASSDPAICATPEGTLHVVWSDTTPGYPVIYHSMRVGEDWSYDAIPNGKGARPTVAAHGEMVSVAWHDRLASSASGAFDVLACYREGQGAWTLPDMVSDTRDTHSLLPRISSSRQGRCHLVWQEEREGLFVIRHADRWPEGWTTPVDISDSAFDARLACALPNKWGQFQFVWSEGTILKHRVRAGDPQTAQGGGWNPPEVACEDCWGLSELAAAISEGGELHVVFTSYSEDGERKTSYLRRKAIERQKVFMPMITR